MEKIKLGISACLLGRNVRYDGGNKLDAFLRDTLGAYAEYLPVCPEFEAGLGVPREPMRLVDSDGDIRIVTTRTGVDMTDRMKSWSGKRAGELAGEGLCGFIFKSRSPSSGMERVKVYGPDGVPKPVGTGVFAAEFMRRFPLVPVEDEGRLHDPVLRENFIESIFVMQRYRELVSGRRSLGALVGFHTEHKLLIMSHSVERYREMGRLVANGKGMPAGELYDNYLEQLVSALRLKPTAKKHVNVLHHVMGYFKRELSPDEKAELLEVIEDYRKGYVPHIVPITLLNHYVRKYGEQYLAKQHYLRPHPVELALRNHV